MKINYVSVHNIDNENIINAASCLVKFNLDFYIDEIYENYIMNEWLKSSYHKRSLKIKDNELRLIIYKNDNIQIFIDFIKKLIDRAEAIVPNFYNNLGFSQDLKDSNNYTKSVYSFINDI